MDLFYQNKPVISSFSSISIFSKLGILDKPGIVSISPNRTVIKEEPLYNLTSLTVT